MENTDLCKYPFNGHLIISKSSSFYNAALAIISDIIIHFITFSCWLRFLLHIIPALNFSRTKSYEDQSRNHVHGGTNEKHVLPLLHGVLERRIWMSFVIEKVMTMIILYHIRGEMRHKHGRNESGRSAEEVHYSVQSRYKVRCEILRVDEIRYG